MRTSADGLAGTRPVDPAAPAHPLDSMEAWTERSRIVLTPIAAPSILGLFGFAAATFMVASMLAGWWGAPLTAAPIIAPFAFFFGGLGQLLAGMWSYRARDSVATAMHGTWGSFWLAWGTLVLLTQTGVVPATALQSRAFGFWFIALAVITIFGALAALATSAALFLVLGLLAAGSVLLAIGFVGPLHRPGRGRRLGAGRLGGRRVLHGRRDDALRGQPRPHHPAPGHLPGGGQRPGPQGRRTDRLPGRAARSPSRPVTPAK